MLWNTSLNLGVSRFLAPRYWFLPPASILVWIRVLKGNMCSMFSSWYINSACYWYTHILNVMFVQSLYFTPGNIEYSNSWDYSPQTWKITKYFHKLGVSKLICTRECISYALTFKVRGQGQLARTNEYVNLLQEKYQQSRILNICK